MDPTMILVMNQDPHPRCCQIYCLFITGLDTVYDVVYQEGQAFYAGGSTSSGNVILGPGKKKKGDIVGNLFKAAREAGAEEVADPSGGTNNTTRVGPGHTSLGEAGAEEVADPSGGTNNTTRVGPAHFSRFKARVMRAGPLFWWLRHCVSPIVHQQ